MLKIDIDLLMYNCIEAKLKWNLSGNEMVDRPPIIFSGEGTMKLLYVPKLSVFMFGRMGN